MNPLDFNWTAEQQVTVINPTDEAYNWKVHGKAYRLDAHKKAKMPGFIAWLYVYGQALNACQKDDKFGSWNDEGFKQTYFERFVDSVDEIVQEVVEPEPEVNTFQEQPLATVTAQEPQAPQVPIQPVESATLEPQAPARRKPGRPAVAR